MIPVVASIASILGSMLMLLVVLGSARAKARFAPEVRRKFLHISMGCITINLPLMFDDPVQVWWLAGLAAGTLMAIRSLRWLKSRVGNAIHSIERESFGELCFPLGVATLFSLADGNYLAYLVPMLILTFGDSLAALVGIYYGRWQFPTPDGYKTLEGSLTMFLISLLCVVLPYGLAGSFDAASLCLAALNFALLITLVEALAWRGSDNFLIPVAGYYLLTACLPLPFTNLMLQALLYSMLVLAFITWSQRRRQEK